MPPPGHFFYPLARGVTALQMNHGPTGQLEGVNKDYYADRDYHKRLNQGKAQERLGKEGVLQVGGEGQGLNKCPKDSAYAHCTPAQWGYRKAHR